MLFANGQANFDNFPRPGHIVEQLLINQFSLRLWPHLKMDRLSSEFGVRSSEFLVYFFGDKRRERRHNFCERQEHLAQCSERGLLIRLVITLESSPRTAQIPG